MDYWYYQYGPCKLAAAVCLSHPNNASAELHRWLAKSKLKYTVGVVNANISSSDVRSSFKEDIIQFLDVFDGPPDAENFAKAFNSSRKPPKKVFDRAKLQSREESVMLSDDEINQYFTEDMRLKKFNETVHPIPPGDPVYILSIF